MVTQSKIETVLTNKTGRYAEPYADAVHDLYVAKILGDRVAAAEAREDLSRAINATLGIGEVAGAQLQLRGAAGALRSWKAQESPEMRFSARLSPFSFHGVRDDDEALLAFERAPKQTIVPNITLESAVRDMIERTPVTIRNAAERTAARISQLYSEGSVTAFAYAAEESVTKRAKAFLLQAFKEGLTSRMAGNELTQQVDEVRRITRPWSKAYAQMASRTNFNTAVVAGRFRQSQDSDIRKVIPAFEFNAIGDVDTRDNHDAADGMILRADNPAWAQLAPPLGYNCRCTVRHVSIFELEDEGRYRNGSVIESNIPAGAFPDPNFRHGGRPDLFLAGY